MKKRDWPEEMDWIRKQDQIMYRLINILSVVAMLVLVCVVAHRATASGAEYAMAAGTVQISEDAVPLEMIRLTVSDHQVAGAIVSVQDALQQASLELDTTVMELSGQNGQQVEVEESEYANLVIAQVGNDGNINDDANTEKGIVGGINDDANMESVIVGKINDDAVAETLDAVGAAGVCAVHYTVVKNDYQKVRGQPDSLAGRMYYLDVGEQVQLDAVGAAGVCAAHYAIVKNDDQKVRGQPDSLAGRIYHPDVGEQAPPDAVYI